MCFGGLNMTHTFLDCFCEIHQHVPWKFPFILQYVNQASVAALFLRRTRAKRLNVFFRFMLLVQNCYYNSPSFWDCGMHEEIFRNIAQYQTTVQEIHPYWLRISARNVTITHRYNVIEWNRTMNDMHIVVCKYCSLDWRWIYRTTNV